MSALRDTEPRAAGEERKVKKIKFSTSPFNSDAREEEEKKKEKELEQEPLDIEVKVQAPEEVPWTDLLLEISMTTAFASLTDGTPILQPRNGLSYVCYFAFVWWIWVSQVCYNTRFRQKDFIHRIWMFLQLAVFCALAAFTKDFDITNGLVPDRQQDEANRLLSGEVIIQDFVTAVQFRQNHLPLLNAKGVSITMASSRILLLVQYCVVFYHAEDAKTLKRKSLLAHIFPLFFSAFCYLLAFLLLDTVKGDTESPSMLISVLKIILWYLPIIVEIASHYVALHLAHFVRYSAKAINARVGTLFLIILGAGLDKITGGFKTIIGNGGLGGNGTPLFIAASVIFIGFFSLYFATPGRTSRLGRKLLLTWFFSQFFFLAALIISLQGIANSLQFSNINAGIINAGLELDPLFNFLKAHPGINLTASDFEGSRSFFRKLGISLEDIVSGLNDALALDDSGTLDRARLQLEVYIISDMLDTLDASPEPLSLLDNKLYDFVNAGWDNTTELTNARFWDIKETIIRDRGTSGLWLYPSTGATILALGLLPFVKGNLKDMWDWAIISCRLLVGGCAILFGLLDIGGSMPIYDGSGNPTKSLIWRLILSKYQLQLVFMAIVIFLLLCVEFVITQVFANRTYLLVSFSDKTTDVEVMSPFENQYQRSPVQSNEPYDPYRGVAYPD